MLFVATVVVVAFDPEGSKHFIHRPSCTDQFNNNSKLNQKLQNITFGTGIVVCVFCVTRSTVAPSCSTVSVLDYTTRFVSLTSSSKDYGNKAKSIDLRLVGNFLIAIEMFSKLDAL